MLRNVHNNVFSVKGVSFKNVYASIGKTKYEKPKNKNLVVHAEPNVFVKYVHAIR